MASNTENPAVQKPGARQTLVMVATRKGAWLFYSDAARKTWRADGPHFLGHVVSHLVLDPRDGRTLMAAAKTGHLGPTVFRSTDRGRTWKEAARPPAFAKAPDGQKGRFGRPHLLADAGPAGESGVWYAGTSPQGLFRSEDGGVTWSPFSGVNDDPQYRRMDGHRAGRHAGRPEAALDHRRPARPQSSVFRRCRAAACTRSLDGGTSCAPLINGLDVVEGFVPIAKSTFHDPHCVRLCPQQAGPPLPAEPLRHLPHRPAVGTWVRIGKNMPKKVGDIGFPMVVHPRDADTAWVFPMDGTNVWPRTSPDGKPAVYVTRNGGKTWQRLDAGLPDSQAWWTVKRQAMTADAARSGGPLLRHDQRRAVGEPRRRPALGLHRAAPAGDLRRGSR